MALHGIQWLPKTHIDIYVKIDLRICYMSLLKSMKKHMTSDVSIVNLFLSLRSFGRTHQIDSYLSCGHLNGTALAFEHWGVRPWRLLLQHVLVFPESWLDAAGHSVGQWLQMYDIYIALHGCCTKNRGFSPKMDGENNGNPYEQMDDFGSKKPLFLGWHLHGLHGDHGFGMIWS